MKKHIKIICLALILLFYAAVDCLFADGVSSIFLIGAGTTGLILANLVIGTVEALIISKLYKTKLFKSILLLIQANIISAFAGWVIMLYLMNLGLFDASTPNAVFYCGFIVFLFIMTIIIEWPFCFKLLKDNNRQSEAFKASLIINACSYGVLIIAVLIIYGVNHSNIKI